MIFKQKASFDTTDYAHCKYSFEIGIVLES